MNKAGKVWGQTQLLLSNKAFEFHKIDFKKGHKCSFHKHKTKYNAFYVIEGTLQVNVQKSAYKLTDATILNPGDLMVVDPGDFHEFIALEDGTAFELYWAEFDPNDIERVNVGN